MITIDEIKEIITIWAAALPYKVRIYLYGSYVKGNNHPPADIDIAVEFCDDPLLDELQNQWIDNRASWQEYLSEECKMTVQLEYYDARIPSFVATGNILLFDALEKANRNETDRDLPPTTTVDPNISLKT